MIKNENGFTLAEVMVAFAILLMASQLLITGFAVARKMESRTNELSSTADLLRENLSNESQCISGTLRMKIDEDTELVGDGWLYQKEIPTENDLVIRVIRVEEGN